MMHGREKTVTVNRLKLIEKLKENLEAHKKDYVEAVVGYRLKLISDTERMLSVLKNINDEGALTLNPVKFNPPQSYESQYVDSIEMLEWSVQENIELDHATFKAYVQNQWTWSSGFDTTAMLYKSFAAGAALN